MSLAPEIFATLSKLERLSEDKFEQSLTAILNGEVDPLQVSAFLLGLEAAGLSAHNLRANSQLLR